MSSLRSRFVSVASTAVVFVVSPWFRQQIFTHTDFVRGVDWIYLPSGVRLLSTLLPGGDGPSGLLVESWLVDFFYFFPLDPVRNGRALCNVSPCERVIWVA